MNIDMNKQFGKVPEDINEGYKPYIVMADQLKRDGVPVRSVPDILAQLREGIMPEQGAVANLGKVRAGFDLLAVGAVSESEVVLLPSCKSLVSDKTDEVVGEGVLAMSSDDGRLKLVGLYRENNGFPRPGELRLGRLSLRLFGLSAPVYEITSTESGMLVGRSIVPQQTLYLPR